MTRIDNLSYSNMQMQGVQRREWLRQNSPQHLQHCATLVTHALQQRAADTSRSTLVLGAGSCTEVPLAELCRASDVVTLADMDQAAMRLARGELSAAAMRKRVQLLQGDLTDGVSKSLARLIARQNWPEIVAQGARAVFDVAAACLEQCKVLDPPPIQELPAGEFGLVISSLLLTQLFSYPLLDMLDHIQLVAPFFIEEQERHRRYQEAAQDFRIRIITAHLHLIRNLLDEGGVALLLSDIRGFVFTVYGTDHDAQHRRAMPLVPRVFAELVHSTFQVREEAEWEWITDLPTQDRPGRGYEVAGYVLAALS